MIINKNIKWKSDNYLSRHLEFLIITEISVPVLNCDRIQSESQAGFHKIPAI